METTANMQKLISKLKLLYIESSSYDADWHSTLHSHPFTELFYVIRGRGHFQFNDSSTFPVKEDDMVIINPNIIHTEVSDQENPLEYIVLGIDGVKFFAGLENDLGFSIHNYSQYKHEILFYLKAILAELQHHNSYSDLVIDNLLNILVINAVRRTESLLDVGDVNEELNKDCVFLENYLNVHFREPITLDHLADLTFMNKYYLSHIFKEHSGMAPIDFVLNKRIIESKKLLENTDLSISQIASIVGFSTSSYFSQYFKRVQNISPSDYRNSF